MFQIRRVLQRARNNGAPEIEFYWNMDVLKTHSEIQIICETIKNTPTLCTNFEYFARIDFITITLCGTKYNT